eukprot:TRINITY_DN923_c0_g3_i1.p1 TRINITY_DN923_c0_g3~~TRINITY_DN923_c0_g3_i1.p1  ORF type:complete len:480 (+),score=91.80 TRINITY_DN923_c0_g3_i1:174-1613(+)
MLDEEHILDSEGEEDFENEIVDTSGWEHISNEHSTSTDTTTSDNSGQPLPPTRSSPIRQRSRTDELFSTDFVALNETEAALYPRYLAMYIPGCKDFTADGEPLREAMEEAKRWIQTVTNVSFPTESFKESLKSGVILCRLLERMIPNSCPSAVTPPTDEVAFESKAMSNIMMFLEACRKKFQLQKQQIFDMDDLLGNGDISNVVVTLYWLGRLAWQNATAATPTSERLDLFAFCAKMKCSRCRKMIRREDERGYGFSLTKQWHLQCESCKCCGSCFLKNGDEEVLCYSPPPQNNTAINREDNNSSEDNNHDADDNDTNTADASNAEETTFVYCLSCACARCSSPFRERNEYIKTEEGARICPDCYALTLCASCFQVLVPETKVKNEMDGKEYCKDCICARASCRKIFEASDQFVLTKDGNHKYCLSCVCSRCQLPLPSSSSSSSSSPSDNPSNQIMVLPDTNQTIHLSCYTTKDKCSIS